MNKKFDQIAPGLPNKIHMMVDIVLLVFGVFFTKLLRHNQHLHIHIVISQALIIAAAWIIPTVLLRLYSPCTPRSTSDNIMLRGIAVLIVTAVLVVSVNMHAGRYTEVMSPLPFMIFCFFSGSFISLVLFKPLAKIAKPIQEALIVGTGDFAIATYKRLTEAPLENRYHVIGFLNFDNQPSELPLEYPPVLGRSVALLDILERYSVTEVYIAGSVMQQGSYMQDIVSTCEQIGMPFAVPLHSLRFERARLLSSSPARDGYLHYMSTSWKPVQYAIKRLIDIIASATALFILSPLLVAVAVVIKITSPGPILFRQQRVGLHGAMFELLKFRSMIVHADAIKDKLLAKNEQSGPVFKMQNDPRITAIGRFIRKYSIDELPQLVNILRGDMTIVGPRPAVLKEVLQYKAWQRRRLSVRPGLTCYWQVSGRNSIGFEKWMQLDLRYVDNWSLALDIQLILQTFPAVLAARGAS